MKLQQLNNSQELYVKKIEDQNERMRKQLVNIYKIIQNLDECESCKIKKQDFIKFLTEENLLNWIKNNPDFILDKKEKDLNFRKMGYRLFYKISDKEFPVQSWLVIRLYEKENITDDLIKTFDAIWDNYILNKTDPRTKTRRGKKGLISIFLEFINGEPI